MSELVADIRELLSFRLTSLAQVSDANGQRWLLQDHDLRLLEWRVIGLTATLDPARFSELAQILNIDKGQLSRIISRLTRRGLVEMQRDPEDLRGRVMSLSDQGRAIYHQVLPGAIRKNQEMVQDLTMEEVRTLFSLLDKLKHITERRAEREE